MSDAVDGFLAESLDDVRSHVRKKYTAWRSLLMRANRLAVTNQHAIKIHIATLSDTAQFCLREPWLQHKRVYSSLRPA